MTDKIIWTYWHQGIKGAPFVVKKCVEQIRLLHTNWTIHVLDKDSISEFTDPLPICTKTLDKMQLPHRSDLLRTQLLIKYGGVWIDPTVYCLQPLDDWIYDCMKSGLFLFHRPGRDRIISNWFIASEKGNDLLAEVYHSLIQYWETHSFTNLGRADATISEKFIIRIINGRSLKLSQVWLNPFFTKVLKLYPYMIYHYMFYSVIQKNRKYMKIFEDMIKISAADAIRLKQLGLLEPLGFEAKNLIDDKASAVQKLDWKISKDKIGTGTNLDYLFKETV